MYFRNVIGQSAIKEKFLREIGEGRIPHAQLLHGASGYGAFPLALAYARYMLCRNPQDGDACGTCPSCVKMNKLVHPDLHFIFPIVKKKNNATTVCDQWIAEWRELVLDSPYFNLPHWLAKMQAGNSQALIYVRESDEITRKLSMKSSEGGYKITIIWLPERMNTECANKLLKLLEEPPAQTLFLLVSEEPEKLLPTILSRTQGIHVPPVREREIARALQAQQQLSPEDATQIAHLADGSYTKALEAIHVNEESTLFFELFVSLMRLSYQRKIREMKAWSEKMAALGRERQKDFFHYAQRMVRENFVYNFRQPGMVYMNAGEQAFATRFAPFIHERNCIGIMDELDLAQKHIAQNVNAKMVFFDLSLKMIVLIKQK